MLCNRANITRTMGSSARETTRLGPGAVHMLSVPSKDCNFFNNWARQLSLHAVLGWQESELPPPNPDSNLRLMGGEDHRTTRVAAIVHHKSNEIFLEARIKAREWFIKNENPGRAANSAGPGDPLFFSPGNLVGLSACQGEQADLRQSLLGQPPTLPPSSPKTPDGSRPNRELHVHKEAQMRPKTQSLQKNPKSSPIWRGDPTWRIYTPAILKNHTRAGLK